MRASKGKQNSMWLRHGEKTLLGIVKATRPYGQEKAPSIQVLRPALGIRMNTLEHGDIASLFNASTTVKDVESDPLCEKMDVETPRGVPLIPVIFSHGLSSNRTMHSGTCRDLASHGYMVFALDHMDKTSSYYETEDG